MNDGLGGDNLIEIDSDLIRNKPLYTKHTTYSANIIGATYIFELCAYNINGVTCSDTKAFVLASIPSAPN